MAMKHIQSGLADERDRRVIENNEQNIVRLMDPDCISRLLMDKGVIDSDDRKQILLPPAIRDKNMKLVGKLLVRGPAAFKNYLNALSESDTDNHTKLHWILQNDTHPVEQMLHDSRQRRISEKVDNHEERIKFLENGVQEIHSEEDMESVRAELVRRNTELEELRMQLQTRDGELQEAREENRLLQKRVLVLEKKIQSLEASMKDQKVKNDLLTRHLQQDRRNIRLLEDRNARLEHRLEADEKKMEKKFQEQEKRHLKGMEEIRHMIRETVKGSSDSSHDGVRAPSVAARNMTAAKTTGGQTKINFTPRNRFQQEEQPNKVKANPPTQIVKAFKKSTPNPEQQSALKNAQKKK